MTGERLHRDSAFAYRCHGCGRCCYGKRIQLNPYEVLRLARNRGLSTGAFLKDYVTADGPYLRRRDDGGCVFLDGTACGVHADRPLVCRLYPLGRELSGDGTEYFGHLRPHPQSEGVYGADGRVRDHLAAQGADDFLAANDRYLDLFYRLYEFAGGDDAVLPDAHDSQSPLAPWFDVDARVSAHCAATGKSKPDDPQALAALHIEAIAEACGLATGDRP